MPPFNWTGALRPTMVSPRRQVFLRLLNFGVMGHAALCTIGCTPISHALPSKYPASLCRYQTASLGQTMQRQGFP